VTLASRSRRSTRPTATCSTSSSRRSPTTATTRTAGASRTAPASSGRSLRPFARSGPTISPSSSASPRPTGSPTATRGTWTTPCGWPPARRGRRRPDRRLRGRDPPGSAASGAGPGYQVPYAEAIREGTDVPVAAVGGITEPTHADASSETSGPTSSRLAARCSDTRTGRLRPAHELGADVAWPVQYRRGQFD